MVIDQQMRRRFDEDGYVVVPGLLEPGAVSELRQAYDRLVEEAEAEAGGAKRGRMIQRAGLASSDGAWRSHIYMQRIVEAARVLVGDDLVFAYDQIIMKPAHSDAATPWHQDAGYWRNNPFASKRALTCWLALSDVSAEHGCMQFIPGSHRDGLVEHADVSERSPVRGALEAAVDASRAVKSPLRAGDCSFHHCLTLHYTSGNAADTPRRGLVTHLYPQEAKQWEHEQWLRSQKGDG